MLMKRKSVLVLLIVLQLVFSVAMLACTTLPGPIKIAAHPQPALSQAKARQIAQQVAAENAAAAPILNAAMQRIEKGLIQLGSCFDFVETVYTEAGFMEAARQTIYAARQTGPSAPPE